MTDPAKEALRLRELVSSLGNNLEGLERSLFAEAGICASDLAILKRLASKGSRPVNTLAPRVGLTSGSMTTAVQRLQRQGLVTTHRDHLDKRRVHVEITKRGKQQAKLVEQKRGELLAPLLSDFTSRETKLLNGMLKKLRKNARHLGDGPRSA
ncbi:MAG: MarR family transcriptional regulator [Verrucomicrobiota bacterium JB023]|nr:MarR family transcriptional regulator [Verrucomicrobiota bacterium JB023]